MKVYAAPMEGITDGIFRSIHASMFEGIDAYFIPFVSPTANRRFESREMRLLLPCMFPAPHAIPQVLCRDSDLFLWCAEMFRDMGFEEININLGCPSGTVTSKGKGAGMLLATDHLKAFLDTVIASSPLPVSIKTRIGFASPDEWPRLWGIYKQYPFSSMTVHMRTRQEFYTGQIHKEILESLKNCPFPVILNGDIFTPEEVQNASSVQSVRGVMIGRGLIANPSLARQAKGGKELQVRELQQFHDALLKAYSAQLPPNAVLGRMREITKYFSNCFENPEKTIKKIFKAKSLEQYCESATLLFSLPYSHSPWYHSSLSSSPYP